MNGAYDATSNASPRWVLRKDASVSVFGDLVGGSYPLSGDIDDAWFFSRVLSESDITTLKNWDDGGSGATTSTARYDSSAPTTGTQMFY